ncbi:ParB N-terminal domain-containing protein [Ciceribacter sp. T2.26MG-112.2]|uniref:ParB N-terminal domain-containing protein n=1 Tax=Ciceribacter sp. T2.26MG-112.2 TaxID=3137154 RepID=UPI0018A8E308|nr:ParB N-terminal domain-containing protein [Ciceribacter naphthalenivorans]
MSDTQTKEAAFTKLPIEIKSLSYIEARNTLNEIKLAGNEDPSRPDRLRLAQVTQLRQLFQVRGEHGRDDTHVNDLYAELQRDGDLKPIVVWRCGTAAILIDGHHRLYAYAMKQRKLKTPVTIPVEWLEGDVIRAIEKAAEGNTERKLQLTPEQRTDLAWRLVAHDLGHSKAELARMTGVSDRTIANMRKTRAELLKAEEELPTTWRKAMDMTKGRDMQDFDIDAEKERRAQEIAKRMIKLDRVHFADNPDVFARALEIAAPRALAKLVAAIQQLDSFDYEELRDELAGEDDEYFEGTPDF